MKRVKKMGENIFSRCCQKKINSGEDLFQAPCCAARNFNMERKYEIMQLLLQQYFYAMGPSYRYIFHSTPTNDEKMKSFSISSLKSNRSAVKKTKVSLANGVVKWGKINYICGSRLYSLVYRNFAIKSIDRVILCSLETRDFISNCEMFCRVEVT